MRRSCIAVLAVLGIVVGCGKESSSAPASGGGTKVTLQLNWKPEPQFGGFYAAQLIGAYAKHGLDVEVRPGGAGAPTVEMLGAGTVPFAIVSADEIVRSRAGGNLLVALFAVYQTNPQAIMTRASRGFTSLADVFSHEGTLAMERGLPYSEFLRLKYGFDKLRVVPSPFGDLSVFRTDENYAMQCFVTSEPLAAKRIGIEPKTFLIAESGYNPYTTVLATSESYLKSNPQTVRAMTDAVREGWQSYLTEPSRANDHMSRLNPTMDPQTFVDSADAQRPLIVTEGTRAQGVGVMTRDRWLALVRQLAELKVIEKPIPTDQCFVDPAASASK